MHTFSTEVKPTTTTTHKGRQRKRMEQIKDMHRPYYSHDMAIAQIADKYESEIHKVRFAIYSYDKKLKS